MNHIPHLSDAAWHKSVRSGSAGCVEVAIVERVVGVRDSKDRQGPVLVFRFDEWNAFLAGVRDGEFNLPNGAAGEQEQRQDALENSGLDLTVSSDGRSEMDNQPDRGAAQPPIRPKKSGKNPSSPRRTPSP